MTSPTPGERDPARLNSAIRQLYKGGSNNTGTVTLRANQTTTVVNHQSCNPNSHISLTPITESSRKIILPNPKILGVTRLLNAATANIAYTGLGFKPGFIQFNTGVSGGNTSGSIGTSDGVNNTCLEISMPGNVFYQGGIAGIQRAAAAGADYQTFTVASFDADGFTLAWVKNGAAGAISATVAASCHPDVSAAGTLPAGLRISSRTTGSFTITHPSRADADQTYTYSITGGA
ncbi:MAG TPA: hypothetical protein VK577_06920 [Bradyrhizobium sp.]|nr:hypothetical protein [Bradyrhizobium sp.]